MSNLTDLEFNILTEVELFYVQLFDLPTGKGYISSKEVMCKKKFSPPYAFPLETIKRNNIELVSLIYEKAIDWVICGSISFPGAIMSICERSLQDESLMEIRDLLIAPVISKIKSSLEKTPRLHRKQNLETLNNRLPFIYKAMLDDAIEEILNE